MSESLREKLKSIMFEQVRTTFSMKYLTHKQANKRLDDRVDLILATVVDAAEKGMPICPPMNDREDIVVSLTNQRRACIDWLKGDK